MSDKDEGAREKKLDWAEEVAAEKDNTKNDTKQEVKAAETPSENEKDRVKGDASPSVNTSQSKEAADKREAKSDEVDEVAGKVENLKTEESSEPRHVTLIENSNEVEVKLADLQADPNSPLYSAKTFEELGLPDELLKGLYAMKFTKPSKIQERALPLLLSDPPRNMIGQSQSGTGKTAAFALTMLHRIDTSLDAPQAICLAPARELADQIVKVVSEMGKFTKVTIQAIVKDSVAKGAKVNAQLIVGTPGSIMDLIQRKKLNTRHVKILVLDEADNMIDAQGMGDQSVRIKGLVPRSAQLVLFSATYAPKVRTYAERFAPNANEIKLKQEELSVDAIKQFYMDCHSERQKFDTLVSLYSLLTIGQSIIFVRKRDTADMIHRRMVQEGHKVVSLHGNMDPAQRDSVMDDFREGRCKVLVTTNVLARGIDILQVNCVINYDIPLDRNSNNPDFETYLHRIGRTGRFGRKGISINFVHDDRSYEQMMEIQNYFGKEIVKVPTDDVELMEKTLKKYLK
ncbi:hypothetical protein BZG36_03583 [Bifiguratus adelaidae]|uniref:RNA helicase n=1 Tax=Bifiguratus adelaidae TaxID=1938954 RepID=A0A261XYV3_9FUNG|nr:hypothetical protein BZG36_03583 [Bifiguratus adelaidae]